MSYCGLVIPGLIERKLEVSDGAHIAYQVAGEGPALVLANGLGGNATAWRFLFERFAPHHRVLSWDYRGLFHSSPPPDWSTLGPASQALDLLDILEAEKIDRFALVGWSMGVQVALEACRAVPDRVTALGLINGVAGRPFDSALGWRFSRHVIPLIVAQMRRRAKLIGRVGRELVGWKWMLPLMQRLGMVGATADAAVFLEVAREFVACDYDLYGATMEALGRHDAWDLLPHLRMPAAVITGDRDLLTPVETARKMAATIPGATLRILRGATHYTPVEFPREVCEEVAALLARADAAASPQPAATR